MKSWSMPFDLRAIITSVTTPSTGSVQFSTDATVNPWDARGPDGLEPSTRIAGNGEDEHSPARNRHSDN